MASAGGGGGGGGGGAPPGPIPVKLAIQPRRFSGESHECSKEFLDLFEEACSCNNWGDPLKALQFPNYLSHCAGQWWRAFKNARTRAAVLAGTPLLPPTWTEIKTAFLAAFASVGDLVNAELKLDSRKQRVDETPEQYIFDIISLCDRVDPNMSEDRRVRFVLRNLREFYLTKIMPMNPSTVEEVLTHMRRISEMKRMTERSQERDIPTFPVYQGENPISMEMREMVRMTQKLVEEIQEQRKYEKEEKEAAQQQRRLQARQSEVKCYTCNRTGHFARDCRNGPAGGASVRTESPGRRVQFANQPENERGWSRTRAASPRRENTYSAPRGGTNSENFNGTGQGQPAPQ